MAYDLVQFGTLELPPYNAKPDVGTGKFYTNLLDLPDGGVYDTQGSSQSVRRATPIVRPCVLSADTVGAFRTAYEALRAICGHRRRLWRLWDDGTYEWTWARMEEIPAQGAPGRTTFLEMELRWVMISPHWYGAGHHGEGWVFADPPEMIFGDGHIFGEDDSTVLTASPQTITVTNAGNRDTHDVAIIVRAGSAAITSLTVYNVTAGCEWTYTGTIAAGNEFMVDSGNWAVTNNAVDAYNSSFSLGANHTIGRLFKFIPGANTIIVTRTGGGTGSEFIPDFYDPKE